MSKVICINDINDGDSEPPQPFDPTVGDILTVDDIIVGYGSVTGIPLPCYLFREISHSSTPLFAQLPFR